MITPSYPPPSPSYMEHLRYAAAPQTEYVQPQPRPLSSRFGDPIQRTPSAFDPIVRTRTPSAFDPISRTSSAFGNRSAFEGSGSYFEDSYTSASDGATIRRDARDSIRVPSANGMTRTQVDYAAMPPPMNRPGILRRATEWGRLPTEYIVEPDPYLRDSRSTYRREETRPRRSSSTRHSASYEIGSRGETVRVEAANSGRRRQSWYEPPVTTTSLGYEDKLLKRMSLDQLCPLRQRL
jgi:hypothetical protein